MICISLRSCVSRMGAALSALFGQPGVDLFHGTRSRHRTLRIPVSAGVGLGSFPFTPRITTTNS